MLLENIKYDVIISKDMISEAATLASESLLHTTSYVNIFPTSNEEQRKYYLFILFNMTFQVRFDKSPESFYGAIDQSNGKLVCFYMIVNSKDQFTFVDKLFGGILLLPFYLGLSNFSRLMEASQKYTEIEKTALLNYTSEDYFALNRMVVHPDYQGKGIGTHCLSIGLRKVDQLNKYIMLTTQDERNVVFYSRLGFRVSEESFISNVTIPYKSWVMIREPKNDL